MQCGSCLQEQDFLDGAMVGAGSLKPNWIGSFIAKIGLLTQHSCPICMHPSMTLIMATKFGPHVPKKSFQYWVLQTGMNPCKICEELSKHEATSNKDHFHTFLAY
jgi:hypothetical protein